jgi:maleate isomerase
LGGKNLMVDALGWRCKIGLLVDASDTVAQPECEKMRPVGVTNHTARIYSDAITGNEPVSGGAHDPTLEAALVRIMSAQPDHIVVPGTRVLIDSSSSSGLGARIRALSKRPCSTAAEALPAALMALECNSTIALVSTTTAILDRAILDYFKRTGFDVLPTTAENVVVRKPGTAMLEEIRQALVHAARQDAGAFVLLDVPCPTGRLAAEAEHWLGKPVISIGTAIYWHALRQQGIGDKVAGFGSLLERH